MLTIQQSNIFYIIWQKIRATNMISRVSPVARGAAHGYMSP